MKSVTIATFRYRHEGEIARQLLEDAGIRCILSADDLGGLRPDIMSANPVRLAVLEEEAEEARELLAREEVIAESENHDEGSDE